MLFALPLVVADLPVHCLRHQVLGDWTFSVTPPSAERSSCGHRKPDLPEEQPDLALAQAAQLRVTFEDPNVAKADGKSGQFSMVYDEGFEFTLEDRSFFAFSRFDFETDAHGRRQNVSKCDETQVGWYSNLERTEFGCFVGRKARAGPALLEAAVPRVVRRELAVDRRAPLALEEHAATVARINAQAQTWRAKVYDRYVGQSLEQLNTRGGLRREKLEPPKRHRGSFLAVDQSKARQQIAALPKDFDWRRVNGTDFLEPVMDQGDCGSCYAVSTMRMLSARHKIKNGGKDPWSISFPLYCSEYNQGCGGGYGVLVSRWSQDVGLIPQSCGQYTTRGQCNFQCEDEGPKYRADGHRYVGGYYGASTEASMMQELHDHGPFVVGVEPQADFMYYTDGIYQNGGSPHSADGWQRVDHAVLLVGWGEEVLHGTPLKYWTLQNSWDQTWGEQGYMRIRRGDNDSGVESIPEAADVVRDDGAGQRVMSMLATR